MKIVVCLFLILGSVFCEVPPPYPPSRFRPSSPQTTYGVPNSQPYRQPQTIYGPPKNAEPLDPSFHQPPNPAKFSSLRNSPNIQGSRLPNLPQRVVFQSSPQTIYGTPNTFSQGTNQKQQSRPVAAPQTIYGAPKPSNLIPQTTYGVPDKQVVYQSPNNFAISPQYSPPQVNFADQHQAVPSRNYGTPSDSATLEEIKQLRQLIQKIEAQRAAQIINSQVSPQSNRHGQSLPNREAGVFRLSLSEQYLPVREPENFKKGAYSQFNRQQGARQNFGNNNLPQNNFNLPRGDQPAVTRNYIPSQSNGNQYSGNQYSPEPQGSSSNEGNIPSSPRTSWNNLDLPSGTNPNVDIQKVEVTQFGPDRNRNRNNNFSTTFRPETNTNEGEVNNNYIPPSSTENPVIRTLSTTLRSAETSTPDDIYQSPQDEVTESPNIAVATAVAGDPNDQQYYLLQPDGRYQKIILPKVRLQTDKQTSFTSNYQLYQNLQVDPNAVYTPIYSVLTK